MVVINTLNIDNEGKKSRAWGLGGENESRLGGGRFGGNFVLSKCSYWVIHVRD